MSEEISIYKAVYILRINLVTTNQKLGAALKIKDTGRVLAELKTTIQMQEEQRKTEKMMEELQ